MNSKSCSLAFFLYLIGSAVCVIPEGEYQIGPVFGQDSRFFGHKHFEAFLDKGQIKPILVKKAILGLGAVGVGALAAGGAALWAKKHQNKGFGGGSGWTSHGNNNGYYQSQSQGSGGWYPSVNYEQSQGHNSYGGSVNFPATDYGYPSSSSGEYSSAGYVDQNAYNYGQGNGYYGWSR